jgi:serine/threonine-protein kinase
MALAAGARLGPYEILSALGAGGMGEVYRARDSKLNRDVAIKVLPDAVAADRDRVARLEREARVLAALNHPNIAHIHGLEDSTGVPALVMELVEGPTLADRIAKGPIPIDEALPIAKQIAEALEAAHDQGIIHRDLKPANIKVRTDGTVKVLDFGLAKALETTAASNPSVTESPTITSPALLSSIGMILGTAAYMSPEQAKGLTADKRSDVWAFGCVVYEMLSGRRAFQADDVSDTLARVLTKDPDWTFLPSETSPEVRRLLRRCLERDRKRRMADIADARLDIEDARTPAADASRPERSPRVSVWVMAATGAIALLVGVIGGLKWAGNVQNERADPPVYLSLDAPADYVLGESDRIAPLPIHTPIVFTTDGDSLIIQAARDGKPQLFMRSLNTPEARPIAGTGDARVPFVSPDGRWIGFWSANELRKVPVEGGDAKTICALQATLGPNGATWGDGDVILFGDDSTRRIMRVAAAGGTPIAVTAEPARTRRHVTPFLLPGGKRFLFTDISGELNDATIMVQDVVGGEPRVVIRNATDGRLLPNGQLAFMRFGNLMTVSFDATRAVTTGDPVVAMRNVMQSGNRTRAGVCWLSRYSTDGFSSSPETRGHAIL